MINNKLSCTRENINQAAVVLKQGGLVAYPTETYYGLAADPFNERALEKLFNIKKRPQLKPILLLISRRTQLDELVQSISKNHFLLMENFWPGPLTLVFNARNILSDLITGKTGTVGIRHSPHPVANSLLVSFGGPITSTSANISGMEPATSAEDVSSFFGTNVDVILDGGKTPGGKGSTLVGYESDTLKCIREGCISFQKIGNVLSDNHDEEKKR